MPRSVGGRWMMLLIVIYLGWLTINHPSDAIALFQTIGHAFGQLFSAVYTASQGGNQP